MSCNVEPLQERTGRVLRVLEKFGFIRDIETHRDIFFHKSELVNCRLEDLTVGDKVTFYISVDAKRKAPGVVHEAYRANDVSLILETETHPESHAGEREAALDNAE